MERTEILEYIAKTLFVSAFADACDEADNGDEAPYFDDRGQRAGAGEDWFDTVTDETPESAHTAADAIARDFEKRNARTLEGACAQWASFDRFHGRKGSFETQFGFALAMEYLGHGVGLWDDIQDSRSMYPSFSTGYREYYLDM